MKQGVRVFWALLLTAALGLPAAALPLPQEPQQEPPQQLSRKERKQQEKKLKDEAGGIYQEWLDNEVGYIITDEERTAFLRLNTNDEREQFIEQFWLRRDPTPDTVENEYREEHYRRIAYANERFSSGKPGWRTDRGRIYIAWGPPDEIESYPSGGHYNRPHEEGGGTTSTFPFEKWRYRYLEGLGNEVILEFVDPTFSGEYRLTMDPSEKDALLYVPNAGLSDMEMMGMASKVDRFTRTDGTRLPTAFVNPQSMNQFDRLDLYARILRPPEVKFRDLEEVVNSRIVRNQIAFDYRFDFLRVTSDTVLVPITVQIANNQMTFQSREGIHTATLNLFGRISTLAGRVVQVFEDVIQRDVPESLLRDSLKGHSVYQKIVPLRPGLYRLDLVIKDVHSGNVGADNKGLRVPRYSEEDLAASTLILADLIERVPTRQVGLGQFVIGATKVRPKLDGQFPGDGNMGVYLQIYNLGIDPEKLKNAAAVEYRILRGKEEVLRLTETSADLQQAGEQLTIERLLPLGGLAPGRYKLEVHVTDQVKGGSISTSADFTVTAGAAQPAARN